MKITPSSVLARTTMATALIVTAIASFAITSLIYSNTRATAPSAGELRHA